MWEKPVREVDLEGALEVLLRMRARAESSLATSARMRSRRDVMIKTLDMVIAETRALMHGEPSILTHENIRRAVKRQEWN